MNLYPNLPPMFNGDLRSPDLRTAMAVAGFQDCVIDTLFNHDIRMASDLMGWDRKRLMRLPHVGDKIADKLIAFRNVQ